MKQTLALKLGQQLTMTPQLQQAIRLLQLSALDLQQEIQNTLEENPMLELADDAQDSGDTSDNDQSMESTLESAAQESQLASDSAMDNTVGAENDVADVNQEFEAPIGEEMPVDSSWEDVYPTGSSVPAGDSDYDPMANRSADQTLADHLLWQLNLTPMAASDQVIALAIIDSIDANGMLTTTTEDLCEALNAQRAQDTTQDPIEHEDVCAVLQRIQDFDPVGVAARDLQECLLLQLAQLPSDTPWLQEAKVLITEYLDLLGSKDFTTLKRKSRLTESELAAAMALIRTLNPRPGTAIAEESADYIVPDVVVRKFEGRWLVELNSEATPQIRINPVYENLARQVASSSDKTYIRDSLQEARWFLKSLQTRHDTLLRVASKIVEVQRGFLEYGAQAMKPLILADIAEAVDLHESTISRVTSRKYMSTPRGVYELKYFFSSHVGTSSGGEVSSTAIRALIEKLTADEDPRKPLSDSKIAAILKDQNINVARRTVAKYRESMSIPPSNERKQLV
ncbi:MAG: RNA polymerase factor sigma-54 [bacterium]